MTSDRVRPPEQRYGYSNALSGLISLIKSEGIQGLTRGLGPNAVCSYSLEARVKTYPIY